MIGHNLASHLLATATEEDKGPSGQILELGGPGGLAYSYSCLPVLKQ
jgi:hypothetical protein